MTLSNCNQNLSNKAKDTAKFASMQGTLIGKLLLEALGHDLGIRHEVKHLFLTKHTFAKYTELDEVYRKMLQFSIPGEERWDELFELLGQSSASLYSLASIAQQDLKGQMFIIFTKKVPTLQAVSIFLNYCNSQIDFVQELLKYILVSYDKIFCKYFYKYPSFRIRMVW